MAFTDLTTAEETAIAEFRKRLQDRFGERFVLMKLFGSVACGERWAESDLDLLVLIQDVSWEEKRWVWDTATDANISHDTMLSPFVTTPQEFQVLRDRELRIATDIDREGILL